MNVKGTQVGNAANLSLSMVALSQLLPIKMKSLDRGSMLDLKAIFIKIFRVWQLSCSLVGSNGR